MAAAIIVLLLLAIIPHHHHGGMWCPVVEVCERDHACNDGHTHHAGDDTQCVEELSFLESKILIIKKATTADQPLLPMLHAVLTDALSVPDVHVSLSHRSRSELRLFYHSLGAVAPVGLRAPPAI